MPRRKALDSSILEAALVGLQAQRQRIEEMIAQVKRMAGRPRVAVRIVSAVAAPRKRRRLSAAGRKHIVAALKKRWAEYRRQKAAAASRAKK